MEWKPRGPVALVGALDTKGDEMLFVRERLNALGVPNMVIDIGVLGTPAFEPDVTRAEIAAAAGARIEDLALERDRGAAITAMQRGISRWFRERREHIAGVLAIGGSAGSTVAAAGMRELRIGVPKVLASTLASGDTRPYVGTSDIAMLHPVGDFAGLNRLTRAILTNAANAIAGMCSLPAPAAASDRPVVAVTMFGVTTPCVTQIREHLDRAGFEALVFHATGAGGQAMEQLIRDGYIRGVIDLTTTELADELAGGVLSAGPDRLSAAGESGIPQVISVGALDMVNFGPRDTVPSRFRERKFYQHNPAVTLMRTTAEESARLGQIIAGKANAARGPVTIALPLRGVSAIDAVGQPFYDPTADAALFDAIRRHAQVKVIELDAHINDAAFAEAAASELMSMIESAEASRAANVHP
jgi:uncharacterized protein (UPF0261 family)